MGEVTELLQEWQEGSREAEAQLIERISALYGIACALRRTGPRDCRLHEGQRGLCFVRARQNDAMVLTTYGRSSKGGSGSIIR